jgi:putative colanic acid biosynthesis acetyltransferase WcaF
MSVAPTAAPAGASSAARADPPLRRLLWRALGRHLLRCTPYNAYRLRRVILRAFGSVVTPLTRVRRLAVIERPWNVTIGSRSMIGDGAVLRGAARIEIGDRCTVSQLAIITTEVRDAGQPGDPRGPGRGRRAAPVRMEDDSWVAADALVLPGSVLRQGAVAGARSMVEGEIPAWMVAVGEPARAVRPRPHGA